MEEDKKGDSTKEDWALDVAKNAKELLEKKYKKIEEIATAPIGVGSEILADSIISLGASKDEEKNKKRANALSKFFKTVTVSSMKAMAKKALFVAAVTVTFPIHSHIIIPTALLGWASYQVSKAVLGFKRSIDKTKEGYEKKGLSSGKALVKAFKEKKFGLAIVIGLSALSVLEVGDSLKGSADTVANVAEEALDNASGLKSEFTAAAAGVTGARMKLGRDKKSKQGLKPVEYSKFKPLALGTVS